MNPLILFSENFERMGTGIRKNIAQCFFGIDGESERQFASKNLDYLGVQDSPKWAFFFFKIMMNSDPTPSSPHYSDP